MGCSSQKDEKKVKRAYGLLPFVLEEVEGEGTVTPHVLVWLLWRRQPGRWVCRRWSSVRFG